MILKTGSSAGKAKRPRPRLDEDEIELQQPLPQQNDVAALAAKFIQWRNDPVAFIREFGGCRTLWWRQEEVAEAVRDYNRVAVPSAHGVGKALALDTPLPTPTGWTTMGEVQPGDFLIDEQGQPCLVEGVSPIHDRPAFRVKFSDRSEIVASGDHLWKAIDVQERPGRNEKVNGRRRRRVDWRNYWEEAKTVTTKEMLKSIKHKGSLRWRVPTSRALQTAQPWGLRHAPYLLGVWLGDGTTVRAEVTCHRDDAAHFCGKTGAVVKTFSGNCAVLRFEARPYLDCPSRYLGGKRIPQEALRASFKDRLALLRGLMDTDGTVGANSSLCNIGVCNEELAKGIQELVVSLGWVAWTYSRPAKLHGRVVNTSFHVVFNPTLNPFSLPRKANRWDTYRKKVTRQKSRRTQRTIVSITPLGVRKVKCVRVSSPSHLYLAGRSMVPTHNSFVASWIAWWWVLCHRGPRFTSMEGDNAHASVKVIITAPSRSSAQEILAAAITARWDEFLARFGPAGMEVLGLGERPTQRGWRDPWNAESGMEWFATKEDEGKESGHASRAAGRHADHLLFIFEEFSGIAKAIYDSIQGSMFGEHRHFLGIGNPVDPSSVFARCCRNPDFHVVRISALEFPNVVEGRNVLPYGPTREAIEEAKRDYGEDSGAYQFKVLGVFPTKALDTFISIEVVEKALSRVPQRDCVHSIAMIGIGCDVARFGNDDTITGAICQGCGIFLDIEIRHGQDTMVTVGGVIAMATRWELSKQDAWQIAVDVTGLGAGVVDRLREQGWGVRAVNFGSKPTTEKLQAEFVNRRAELWGKYRKWLTEKAHLKTLKKEYAERLRNESTSVRSDYDSAGRTRLEPKDVVKLRTGLSPDLADMTCLAVCALIPIPTMGQQGNEEELREARDPYYAQDHKKPEAHDGYALGKKSRDIAAELNDW